MSASLGSMTLRPDGRDVGTRSPAATRAWVGLPLAATSRILVLFVALASMKLVMLVTLRRHLYQMHWRVSALPTSWSRWVVFAAFLVVGIASLVSLGRACGKLGIRSLRVANGIVVVLGLLLIGLTLHAGDKSYIYPLMNGILGVQDVLAYLSMDLFFRPPFLAAWLFAYALGYYLLVRTGHEGNAFHLTALVAGAYAITCWREIAAYAHEIEVAGCFGLAGLLTVRSAGPRSRLGWLLLPAVWTALLWGLFRLVSTDQLGGTTPYLNLVLSSSVIIFGAATWLARRQGFLPAWGHFLPFYLATFVLLANVHYPLGSNFRKLLCLGAELPHYVFGEALVTAGVAVVAWLYGQRHPEGGWRWLDALILCLIGIAFVDLRLTQIMYVRLDWEVFEQGYQTAMISRLAKRHVLLVGGVVALGAVGYAGAVSAVQWWWRSARGAAFHRVSGVGAYLAIGSLALALVGLVNAAPDRVEGGPLLHLVRTSPLWRRATASPLQPAEFRRTAQALGLGDFEPTCGVRASRARRNLNVLMILQESLYNEHLSLFGSSEATQPRLAAFRDRMELFPNFFSNFAGSMRARFATFTGLYPVQEAGAFSLHRVKVKSLFELLHANGYHCSMFYSSSYEYMAFGEFLRRRGLDEMYDADNMPVRGEPRRVAWGVSETDTLEAIRAQIRRYGGQNQKFFLTYVPAAPHYPYDHIPSAFLKFKKQAVGDYTPLYLDEVLYMDWVVTSILDQLKVSGLLDRTLVILTSDHGEMLGANGGPVGHGWVITPRLTNVPLIIMDPQRRGYRCNYTLGSQIDLLPTILDLLGLPVPSDQLYEGRSLYTTNQPTGRLIYLNSHRQYAVIASDHFVGGTREADEPGSSQPLNSLYTITNNSVNTEFIPGGVGLPPTIRIHEFDRFQDTFLRNYTLYCEALRGLNRPAQ